MPENIALDKIEHLIDPNKIFRISRSYIVNFIAIEDIIVYSSSRLKVCIRNWKEEELIVSRERVSDFKKWMER